MLLFSTHKYSCEIVVVGLCIGKYIGETDNVHCDVRDLIVYARLAFCMCTLHEILYIDRDSGPEGNQSAEAIHP